MKFRCLDIKQNNEEKMNKARYIIDVHQHLWGQQKTQYEKLNTLESLVEKNNENDIIESWLSCIPLDGREWSDQNTNALVADAVKRYPGKFRGMGFVLLGHDNADKVKEFKDRGFFGLKIIFPLCSYDDPKNDQIWEAAVENKMPVTFHTGPVGSFPPNYPLHPLDMFPDKLYRISCYYPELIMLIAHMGNNHFADATALAIRENVYLDCAGGRALKAMPRSFFDNTVYWKEVQHKIAYGVDQIFPIIADEIELTAKFSKTVNLSKENIELMWHGNAEKIIKKCSQ